MGYFLLTKRVGLWLVGALAWVPMLAVMGGVGDDVAPEPLPRGVMQAGLAADLAALKRDAPPLLVGSWEDAETASALIRVGWNSRALLIHAEVFDADPRPGPAEALFRGDGIEIYLDLRVPEERTRDYLGATRAGQIVLAPPAPEDPDQARPQLGKGSGSLRDCFDVEAVPRGHARTATGYEVWIELPAGDWLGADKDILADFVLNERNERTGGQFFAFGKNFNWKETSRFGTLTFAEAPPSAHLAVTSTFGIRGRKGSNDLYEDVTCTALAPGEMDRDAVSVAEPEHFAEVVVSSETRTLGDNRLTRIAWRGRYSGDRPAQFSVAHGGRVSRLSWPANLSRHRALLERIAAVGANLPSGHLGQMFVELAREEVLSAMWLQSVGGAELVAMVEAHLEAAARAAGEGDGTRGAASQVLGYHSRGQDRWIPFLVREGKPRADGTVGIEIDLHGNSGFDFTRGAFVRRHLPPAERPADDAQARPERTVVSFYGGGNDYHHLGIEDWEAIPPLLRQRYAIAADDIHLRGHSMGASATFFFGGRIPGLGPGLPFKTFTPAAGGARGDARPSGRYDDFVVNRTLARALGGNFQRRPFLLVHGIEDTAVPVASSRDAKAWLAAIGNPADILEIPAQGHGPRGYEPLREIWLARQRPQPIREWMAYEPRFARANGVAATAFEHWGRPAVIRFAEDGRIDTENVAILDLADWPGPWPATVNGQAVAAARPVWTLPGQAAPTKTVENCGPIREVARQGFVIVIGTRDLAQVALFHGIAVRLRDALLRSEWGLKEDWLKIYRDTDADIPDAPWRIIIGAARENAYLAAHPGPQDTILADVSLGSGVPSGLFLLRPDRHLLIHGDAAFYAALADPARRLDLPFDADFQLWHTHEGSPVPILEGEFDRHWRPTPSLMRLRQD